MRTRINEFWDQIGVKMAHINMNGWKVKWFTESIRHGEFHENNFLILFFFVVVVVVFLIIYHVKILKQIQLWLALICSSYVPLVFLVRSFSWENYFTWCRSDKKKRLCQNSHGINTNSIKCLSSQHIPRYFINNKY